MKAEIIAELEINHCASTDIAKQMIYAAAKAGADTVKFQAFNPEEFTSPASPYRAIFSGLKLTSAQLKELRDYAEICNVGFLLTIADLSSVAEIKLLNLSRVKVGSTNVTNHLLLRDIARTGVEIILSTGASTIEEIAAAISVIRAFSDASLSLMHCTVAYPCDDSCLNLLAIKQLQKSFPSLPIGFSDHSIGPQAAAVASALGVFAFEKHFTLSEYMDGPDHHFCANPSAFSHYVESVRTAEKMLGDGIKKPLSIEDAPRRTGRRYLAYAGNYTSGSVLCESDFLIQRQSPDDLEDGLALMPTLDNIKGLTSSKLLVDVSEYSLAKISHFS